jgi:hypothetical protein
MRSGGAARAALTRLAASPWLVGLLLGALHFAREAADALRMPVQRFDEGIQLSSGALITHGELPLRDYYQPYGPGFGLPGAVGRWLFGDGILADRLIYLLAPALVTTLAYVLVTRRSGWPWGLAVAVLTLASSVPRHALCWAAIFGGLVVAQRAIERAPGRSFGSAAAARPRTFLVAGSLIGLAAWFRLEYGVAAVVWAIFILWTASDVPRRRRMLLAGAPVVLALLPYAAVALLGGLTDLSRWVDYALFGFRKYRGQPIDLSPFWRFFRAPFHGQYDRTGALLGLTYVAALLLALVWLAHLALSRVRRRGLFEPDPTLISPFLAIVAVFVSYTLSIRFTAANGGAVIPGVWAAWLTLRPRPSPRLVRGLVAAAAVLVVLPVLKPYKRIVSDIQNASALNRAPEATPKLGHIPVGVGEWPSMAGIHALWRQSGMSGRRVFATNRRNDLTYANGAYLYWFLDARNGAWSTTYDPGIADRDDVERDAARDLCANRAGIVEEDQDPSVSSNGEFGLSEHQSRYLDEFVALNYRSSGVVGFYRLRTRETPRCTMPDQPSDAAVRARREVALRREDTPEVAALSILLVGRAQKAGRRPAADDVAGALLDGYWVADADLPSGPQRAGLLALRERRVVPGEWAAATAPGSLLMRLATTTAYVTYRPPEASPAQNAAVVRALLRLARDAARWPSTIRNLFAMEPPGPAVFRIVERAGGRGVELERIRFQYLREQGRLSRAIVSGRHVVPLLAGRPLEQGQALLDLATVFDAAGDHGCAARARALGDGVPGVHAVGQEDPHAACGTAVPAPALGPERP